MSDYTALRTMMVDTQVRPSDVTKYPILEAMLSVPRERFVPEDQRSAAYAGTPVSFGANRSMLEPRDFAKLLDAVDIQPNEVVLDLGCGLGYSAAIIANLAEFVVAVEDDSEIAEEAQANLSSNGIDNVAVLTGPLAGGNAKHGPFDVVIVEGAIQSFPEVIVDQLNEGGRAACIFTDGNLGEVRIGSKIDGAMHWQFAFNGSAALLNGFEKVAEFAL
ncbi:MAG: protein-L-isoaspartate O-methyltransferase family protein [Halocynthiibacter sp.]